MSGPRRQVAPPKSAMESLSFELWVPVPAFWEVSRGRWAGGQVGVFDVVDVRTWYCRRMKTPARVALTAVVLGGFCFGVVATSKKPVDNEKGAPAEASGGTSTDGGDGGDGGKAEVPSSEGWKLVHVKAAGVQVRLPDGVTLVDGVAGNDPSFSGRYFRIHMPSGYEVSFQQNSGAPVELPEEKKWLEEHASFFEGLVVDAEDALVAARREPPPIGEYWEATVCSKKLGDKPLCTSSAGASEEDGKVIKMTHDEVLQVVAIGRSIDLSSEASAERAGE